MPVQIKMVRLIDFMQLIPYDLAVAIICSFDGDDYKSYSPKELFAFGPEKLQTLCIENIAVKMNYMEHAIAPLLMIQATDRLTLIQTTKEFTQFLQRFNQEKQNNEEND